jgi:hypothetical protein
MNWLTLRHKRSQSHRIEHWAPNSTLLIVDSKETIDDSIHNVLTYSNDADDYT